jgi:hypothetical protein
LVQKPAAHSQIAANRAMHRTMILNVYRMLSNIFNLLFLLKAALRVPLGTGEP